MTRLTYAQRRYRDDAGHRLRKVNYNRARLGLPPVADAAQIGQDLVAHARQRERGERGRFI